MKKSLVAIGVTLACIGGLFVPAKEVLAEHKLNIKRIKKANLKDWLFLMLHFWLFLVGLSLIQYQ